MNVIYVDDEPIQIKNFCLTVEGMKNIDSLETFEKGQAALEWVKSHSVDVAFLDIEMPIINGIELAKKLKEINCNIRIIFVTAYEQYALDAFGVDAIGYLLKPYTSEDVEKELTKAYYIMDIPKTEIQIKTMPNLQIRVNGRLLILGKTKQVELLAYFIDRGEEGVMKLDVMETLWAGYSSESVYWTTMSRLKTMLDENGMSNLLVSKGQAKYINMAIVDCDLYRMLNGDKTIIDNYNGEYLEEYIWSEERKQQLDIIKQSEYL